MAAADDDGNGRGQQWRMTMVADDNSSQDWMADYDREG
jgi:hypothetical protein